MKQRASREVILALDPFAASDPAPSSVAELNAWAERQGLKIRPAYVTSLPAADLGLGHVVPLKDLERKLEFHAKSLGFQFSLPAQIVIDETASRRGRINSFLRFAEREGATAIALTSHGRSGIDRALLGSFAEGILRESPRPVFFLSGVEGINAGQKGKATVFFATDFSPASRAAFDQFLRDFRPQDRRLVIFHSINFPVPYAPMGTAYMPENYFSEQEAWAKRMAEEWTLVARNAGVETKAEVRLGGLNLLAGKEVIAAAKAEEATIIVMATASKPLERTLLGSVAFDIFRARQLPVLIYGPSSIAAGLGVPQGGRAS